MARLLMIVSVAGALLLGLAAAPAHADGDPASDALIFDRVFVGFGASEATPQVRELLELTAEASRKGLPIRVAVIREVTDLGAVPSLFGQPQRYATFLGQELRFVFHETLVVVMGGTPGGVGVFGPGATSAAKAAVHGIAVPAAGDADALAQLASTAIRRVAAANGKTLTTPRAGTASGQSHASVFGIAGAVVAFVALLAGLLVYRRRR